MIAAKIKYIAIHCTAGYGNVQAIKNFWKNTLKWKNPGYHVIIDIDGTVHYIHPFDKAANGVRHFNSVSLHISYIGGVDPKNYKKAVDTRTDLQKQSIEKVIIEMRDWLQANGKTDMESNFFILGHRDFSPDVNKDNIIASWERIKECPSFDAIKAYKHLNCNASDQTLPYNLQK